MTQTKFKPAAEQLAYLKKGAAEIIPENELVAKLENSHKTEKPLRVYLGVDPTAPDLHLGHTVVLRKLKHFQDLGHTAIFLIGDFSAMIGDPTGVSETRPPLSREQVEANAKTYLEQVFKILDRKKTEVRYNSEWLSKMNAEDVVRLCAKYPLARMLEREDFRERLAAGWKEQLLRPPEETLWSRLLKLVSRLGSRRGDEQTFKFPSSSKTSHVKRPSSISIHELLYPLLTALDAVELKSDIEIGATEQKFNLLVHRDIQREYGLAGEVALTMPILVGLDGQRKMSKSLGNYVGITESPENMFGKLMSIPDSLMWSYLELLTDRTADVIENLKTNVQAGTTHPKQIKVSLASEIVRQFYGEEEVLKAAHNFQSVFSDRKIPQELRQIKIKRAFDGTFEAYEMLDTGGRLISKLEFPLLGKEKWSKILWAIKEIGSVSEAERLIRGRGLEVNNQVISDPTAKVSLGQYGEFDGVIRMGKKKYFRLIIE
jgi:tyrosyl-tRNA synthetase